MSPFTLLRGGYLQVRNCVNPASCRVQPCARDSRNSLVLTHKSTERSNLCIFFGVAELVNLLD